MAGQVVYMPSPTDCLGLSGMIVFCEEGRNFPSLRKVLTSSCMLMSKLLICPCCQVIAATCTFKVYPERITSTQLFKSSKTLITVLNKGSIVFLITGETVLHIIGALMEHLLSRVYFQFNSIVFV